MGRTRNATVLAVLSIFGTAAILNAQYAAPADPDQQDSQVQEAPPAQQDPQQGSAQQDPGTQDQAGDQQRAVARLSIAQGDVNVKRGDTGELVAAVLNAPLMAQDHLQTSAGSRAEVQLDYANMIRLAPNTDIGFGELAYHRYQVQLGAGTVIYRVLRDSNAQAEVDTPTVAVRPSQQGVYRISVLDDGSTEITVRSGGLDVDSQKGTQQLQAGQTMLVRGDASDPEFQITDQVASDQFDDWSANRDRQLLASQSYQHVSPDIYGADDLDNYGNWVPSQYGNVWEPQNPGSDWAPYSNGQWVWEPYYGWTWVDAAPWGWAPYHYGRWFWNGGHGWCWWPGSVASSYFWSPALVGFFGWGGGGFEIGLGGLGWVALAPFEVFHPWWGGGFYGGGFGGGYGSYTNINNINNVNIVNNTNITNIYRNAGVKGACITSHGKTLTRGQTGWGRASGAQLRNASLFRGQIPVKATQANRQFANRQATPNPRLTSVANRQFFHPQRAAQPLRASSRAQQAHGQSGSRQVSASAAGTRGGFQRVGQGGSAAAQRSQALPVSRGGTSNTPQNFSNAGRMNSAPQSLHGVSPNTRSQMAGQSSYRAPTQTSKNGWHHFGEAPTANGFHGAAMAQAGRVASGQRSETAPMSRGGALNTPPNSGSATRMNSAPQSLHGVPPNVRSQMAGQGSYRAPTRASNNGWHRFAEPSTANGFRGTVTAHDQSGWHSFGQPQHGVSGSYGAARPNSVAGQPGYRNSYAPPNYGGNYQSRPLGANQPAARPPQSFSGSRSGFAARPSYAAPNGSGPGSYRGAPSMPHYNAPSMPHYSAPSMPHYSAPSMPHSSAPQFNAPHNSAPRAGGGGGSFHGGGGGAPHGGGGSQGGGHSSSGGHQRR